MVRGPLLAVALVALAVTAAACEAVIPSSGTSLSGAIFTDLRVDMPCDDPGAPARLAGIGLTFRGPDGVVLGTTRTGAVRAEHLPADPAEAGPGCRYSARYAVTLPAAASYTVDFDVPDPPARGGYFSGTDELRTQTLTRDELARRGSVWSFELPPSYVVP